MDRIQKDDRIDQSRDELTDALRNAIRRVARPRAEYRRIAGAPIGNEPQHPSSDRSRLKALERITDGYYVLDDQWRFIAVNPKAERHFGKKAEDLIGCDIWKETGTPEDSEILAHFRQAMKTRRPVHFEARSRIRPGYWAKLHLFPHDTYLEVYFRDISARKKVEADLRHSELRFRKIFEHAAMGIAIADWEGRIMRCNPAYCKMLGYSATELHRLTFDRLLHPDDIADNLAQIRRIRLGEISSFEITNRYIHKEGRPVWVHKRVSSLPDRAGHPTHLMALVNDVTPQIEAKTRIEGLSQRLVERTLLAEARAEEVQKLALAMSSAEARERRRLAAILHDTLQQMLVSLKLKLNREPQTGRGSDDTAKINDILDTCIDTCRRLTVELQPPLSKSKGILETIRWLCRRMEALHDMEIDLIVEDDITELSPVLTEFLVRSLRELLFNVVKHSGELSASVTLRSEDGQIAIAVQDWGLGSDAEQIRAKRLEATAFGLFEIEDRLALLGGQMQMKTGPNQGFGVYLRVPMEVSAPIDENTAAPGEENRRQEETLSEGNPPSIPDVTGDSDATSQTVKMDTSKSYAIILAEDHTMLRQGLRDIINAQAGLNVVTEVDNGKELLRIMDKIEPDMVVLDITMPEMGGLEAAREIKAQHPNVRVLMMSMHNQEHYVADALAAGARGYLLKEDSSEELLNAIDAIRQGRTYLSSKLSRPSAAPGPVSESGVEGGPDLLTKREHQVLHLLTDGLANQQMAEQLGISIRTVQQHRTNIRKKLGLKHTADLVRYAVTMGRTHRKH
jgi:PAS domain S-box-containing protein